MTDIVKRTQCPSCLDSGMDNLVHYSDGTTWCFACSSGSFNRDIDEARPINKSVPRLKETGYRDLTSRGISKSTCEFFGYEVGKMPMTRGEVQADELVHGAPYYSSSGELIAMKIRNASKKMTILGNGKDLPLFGMNKYAPNPNVFITVVEGEIDALSVAEVQGTQWPVVSVPAGASSAKKAIAKHMEYLRGFKYVVIAFDNDDAGREAAQECQSLFYAGEARICTWDLKDANEMLTKGMASRIKSCIFNAKSVKLDSVIKPSEIEIEDIKAASRPGTDIIYPQLSQMIGGLKKKSIYTLVAKAKAGKSLLTKEIALDLVKRNHKVGVLYLEGDAVSEALHFVALEENTPHWLFMDSIAQTDDSAKDVKKKLEKFDNLGLYLYNHKGDIDKQSVFNAMQYMITALECNIIILDNLSISIAGSIEAENERRMIDRMLFELVRIVNHTNATILTVVHVNQKGEGDEGLSRKDVFGSGAFVKYSEALIGVNRLEDNKSQILVLANRNKGIEGPADELFYNQDTGRLLPFSGAI